MLLLFFKAFSGQRSAYSQYRVHRGAKEAPPVYGAELRVCVEPDNVRIV